MTIVLEQVVVRLTRRTRPLVGDVREQITVALSGLNLIETAPKILAHIGSGVSIDKCELWGIIGRTPTWQPLCRPPAAIGLRLQLVAKAAQNAGFSIPMSPIAPRAEWVRISEGTAASPWCELPLWVPGCEPDARRDPLYRGVYG